MQESEVQRAVLAAMSTASELALSVEDAIVLSNSNRLVLRLMPCDVVARMASTADQASARMEIELARRLAETDSPLAVLEPRVEPRIYVRDGFAMGMWTYYEPVPSHVLAPTKYARALERLHVGMRQIDVSRSHFSDRLTNTQQWIASRDVAPELGDVDRELVINTLVDLSRSITEWRVTEQLLHGEPHPWNVLNTPTGPLFTDFENCVRGPVEYDL